MGALFTRKGASLLSVTRNERVQFWDIGIPERRGEAIGKAQDFKYPIAAFEHYQHASPEWKPNILAASVHFLHGTTMEDSDVIQETREELHCK